MRTFLTTAAVLFPLTATPALAIDPFFPGNGNAGIDVKHYDLEIAVGEAPDLIEGRAQLFVRAEERLTAFTLDLHALKVSVVKINGAGASFTQVGDKVEITPIRPIPKNRRFVVTIHYGGTVEPLPDPTLPGAELGWMTFEDAAYVLSEPLGASTFFPANDELDDKATFDIAVTVAEPYVAAANGKLKKVRDLGDKRRFEFEMDEPMTTWLATVHVNEFKVTRMRAGKVPITLYTTDDSAIERLGKAKDMLPWFQRLFGEYPFDTYGSVTVDDPALEYALETQTLSTFPMADWALSESVVAHELAHQWFGNSVSVSAWKDLWLAEGMATYLEILWPNRTDPKAFEDEMLGLYAYVRQNNVGPAVVEKPDQLFTARTYYRGAMALYAVERATSRQTLIKIMREWADRYEGKSAGSEDFIRLAVKVSKVREVRAILEAWLYDEAVPTLPGVDETALAAVAGTTLRPLAGDYKAGLR